MMTANIKNTFFLLGFILGFFSAFIGGILLGHLNSLLRARKRGRYDEFKIGNDLFDVDVPQILPGNNDDTESI